MEHHLIVFYFLSQGPIGLKGAEGPLGPAGSMVSKLVFSLNIKRKSRLLLQMDREGVQIILIISEVILHCSLLQHGSLGVKFLVVMLQPELINSEH